MTSFDPGIGAGMDVGLKPVVLIADDVPANIHQLAQLLKDDYRIKVATDGRRCLDLVRRRPRPDLVMLDIEMPQMDGYEVCRQLQSDEKTKVIPIIFVTAKNQVSDEEHGLKLGAVDYITKPFQPVIVEARVKNHIALKRQSDRLHRMAMRDQLTSLYNRHYLMDIAPRKIGDALRHGYPISLVVIDIDHFKAVNDRHGHATGDGVLREIAALLQTQSRAEDVVARVGGEEFVIFLGHCDLRGGVNKAELVRAALERLRPHQLKVTASFGVAELMPGGEGFESLFQRADTAVFQAKAQGRNRVVAAE